MTIIKFPFERRFPIPDRVKYRLEQMKRDDRIIREALLSVLHWFGPLKKDELVELVCQIRPFDEPLVEINIRLLISHGLLYRVHRYVFPKDRRLTRACGEKHIGDAIKLLELPA